MTDASPVNRYLLLDRASDFTTEDKVLYALRNRDIYHNAVADHKSTDHTTASSSQVTTEAVVVSRCWLLRSLDEVKRAVASSARGLIASSPSTGTAQSGFDSPVRAGPSESIETAALTTVAAATSITGAGVNAAGSGTTVGLDADDDDSSHPDLLEADEALHRGWHDGHVRSGTRYWNWPIEVLYQRYHIYIAIDLSPATFAVAENGEVVADRVLDIVEDVVRTLRTTEQTRTQELRRTIDWLSTHVTDAALRARLRRQVWCPALELSIVLLNVGPVAQARKTMGSVSRSACLTPREELTYIPRRLQPASEHGSCSDTDETETPHDEASAGQRVALLGPSQTRLSTLNLAHYDTTHTTTTTTGDITMTPLLTRQSVHAILRDDSFLPRLRETLLRYETVSRTAWSDTTVGDSGGVQGRRWPHGALDRLIEQLLRSQPASPCAACTSLVLVHNKDYAAMHDTLPLIETMLQRRNCILSLVSLSTPTGGATVAQGSPLTRLLAAVGGFAVNIGYWRAMASERLNRDWCTHFEGARCLAQQLFVQLITRFPVVTEGGEAVVRLLSESAASTLLYDGDHGLPDFVLGGHALTLLRSIAAARLNQGWSVVLDYVDEKSAAGLYARSVHHMQGGSLTLYYELNINRPAVYRRVRVTGTAPLVAYFCHHLPLAPPSATAPTSSSQGTTADTVTTETQRRWGVRRQGTQQQQHHHNSAVTYLTMLRLLLDNWLRAEQVTLPLIDTPAPALQRRGPCATTAELCRMTEADGMRAEWVDVSTVRTVGLFFQATETAAGRQPHVWPPFLAGWSKAAELTSAPVHRRPGNAAERLAAATRTAARAAITRAMTAGQRHVRLASAPTGETDDRDCPGNTEGDVLVFLSADDQLPGQRYLVQFFDCEEPALTSSYAATTSEAVAPVCVIECRVSLLLTEGTSAACGAVVRAILRSLRHVLAAAQPSTGSLDDGSSTTVTTVMAASNATSEAGVPPRLVLHLGSPSSCNAQALFLTLATQGRRQTPLLLSLAASPARRERGDLAVQAPTKVTPAQSGAPMAGMGRNASWYATLHQALRMAYVDSPWALANMVMREWLLACPESANFSGEEIFHYALMRRLCNGYTLLSYQAAPPRAIVHLCTDSFAGGQVDVMDVLSTLDLSALTSDTPPYRPAPQTAATAFHLRRFMGPYALLRHRAGVCRRDIQEDMELATALHSFRVLALRRAGSQPGRVSRPRASDSAGPLLAPAALTLVPLRERALLRFLHPRYTHVISLPVPGALDRPARRRLRSSLAALLRALGDRSGDHGIDAFAPALLRHALWPRRGQVGGGTTAVQVSVLTPLRSPVLLFLLLAQDDTDEEDGMVDETGPAADEQPGATAGLASPPYIRVAVAALNAELLHYGLVHHYAPSCHPTSRPCPVGEEEGEEGAARPDMEGRAMPECAPDAAVMHALRHLLYTFMSIHTTQAMLCGGLPPTTQAAATDDDRAACAKRVRDLLHCSAHLGLYMRTLDVTYLRAVVLGRGGGGDVTRVTGRLLTALVQPELWADASQASLFVPYRVGHTAARQSKDNKDETTCAEPPPMLLKLALVQTTASGSLLDCVAVDEMPLAISSRVDDGCVAPASTEWWPVLHDVSSGESFPDADMREDSHYTSRHRGDEASASVAADAAAKEDAQPTTRLLLFLFFRTVPVELIALYTSPSRAAPSSIAREVLRSYTIYYTTHKPPRLDFFADTSRDDGAASTFMARAVHPRFAAAHWTANDLRHLRECGAAQGEAALPPAISGPLARLTGALATRIATYALASSVQAHPFLALRTLWQADDGAVDDAGADDALRHLAHRDAPALMARCRNLVGLRDLLSDVVLPALRAARRFEVAVLPVQFTQQTSMYGSIDPVKAARDVFRCCVEEDGMCVLESGDSYVFVPNANAAAASSWWLVVRVLLLGRRRPFGGHRIGSAEKSEDEDGEGGGDGRSEAVMYCYPPLADAEHGQERHAVPRALVESLWAYLHRKVTQVSQLHLLKQLRDTQHASAELIPPFWGDQFNMRGRPSETAVVSNTAATSTYFLHGQNVLEIPIYAKLQHQCKKILSCIASNSARLELITIYNRDQCFVVADDEQGDVFHYVRLVFVKDVTRPVALTSPVRPVGQVDRCPQLLVQLFSATPSRASIQRPLRKLQDFCYLLAVQELQGYLNYVQNTMISFNDLVFLQNQRLQPIVIELDAAQDGGARQDALGDVALRALALLFLHLRENKFKHFRVEEEQTHATSNFVEHYNLEHHGATPRAPARLLTQPEAAERQTTSSAEQPATAPPSWPVLRFVKIVDGVTDVLVSCVVHVVVVSEDTAAAPRLVVVVDRFLTRTPAERYTNGESEKLILRQLDDYVADVSAQLSLVAKVQRVNDEGMTLRLSEVPVVVDELLALGARACSGAENTMLQYCSYGLGDITAATLPYLIERLCGALAMFGPCCVQRDVSGTGVPTVRYVPGFPCRWREALQRSVTADETCVYITCGLTVWADATALTATRVVPFTVDGVAITARTTCAAQSTILKEHGLLCTSTAALPPCIALHVSLRHGLHVVLFNVRDADFVRSLLDHVVREVASRAGLLHEVLLQRLGYECVNRRGVGASGFSEADLARWCCGDASHIVPAKPLAIRRDVFRRRIGHVRFCADDPGDGSAASLSEDSETLVGLLVSLYNAGLVINYAFTLEDAVLLLYNESTSLPLAACRQRVRDLVAHGLLMPVQADEPGAGLRPQRPDMTAQLALSAHEVVGVRGKEERHGVAAVGRSNYRLAHSCELPADVLIVCDYHRHVTVAHMMAEAQSARAGLRGALVHCDTLWRAGPQNHVHAIARAVVALQARSRQVFGVRVPNFSLLRERWQPEDDVLDPVLPPRARQRQVYGHVVDATLQRYMNFLRRRHPALCLIDLDPDDAVVTQDGVLLNRLRCRYGKVVVHEPAGQEEVILFSPHLWYAVIPLADLLRSEDAAYRRLLRPQTGGGPGTPAAASEESPISVSGVFIVEVGLQVTHYALDFFVINGPNSPAAVIAEAAALFRQSLAFDSTLYDLTVEHYARCLRRRLCALPGEQPIATALAHLLRYYPAAPLQSRHAAAVSAITDGNIIRLRELRVAATVTTTPSTPRPSADDDEVLYLVPQSRERRVRVRQDGPAVASSSGTVQGGDDDRDSAHHGVAYYDYVGLIDWRRAQLFVLLVADETGVAQADDDSVRPEVGLAASISDGLAQAKEWLLAELLDRTQQERLASAYGKFVAGCGDELASRTVAQEPPSFDEYGLLRGHVPRVLLRVCGAPLDAFPAVLALRAWSVWDDKGDAECDAAGQELAIQAWLRRLVAVLYPHYVAHLLLLPCEASCSAMSSPTLTGPEQTGTTSVSGDDDDDGTFASRLEEGLERSEVVRSVRRQLFQPTALYSRVIVTLAAPDVAARFVAVEWVYAASVARYIVQEAVLYGERDKAISAHGVTHLTRLTRAERALVHALKHILASAMWYVGDEVAA